MRKYEVIIKSTILERYIVEAKDKEEAQELWANGWSDYQDIIDQFDSVCEEVRDA
tara:strand:+ start:362 stop:526 length:165 start_codon:yes stop_codon:yes gene_type:complete